MKPTSRLHAHRLGLATISSSIFALAAASQAQAQDAQSQAATNNEIVVTAQFREQSLQDTPLAITAVSSEMLEARGSRNVTDIAASAPNVTLEVSAGQRGNGLTAYIRGIGQYNTAPFYEPGVGTYIDDVYIASMQGSLLNLVDLDRVEVLRGPQGTLAGKNSVGGAIKLFTQKPQGDGTGYAQATYGSLDHLSGRAAADFALTDNLFARLNIAAQDEDGYVDRVDYACENPGSGLPRFAAGDDSCKFGTLGGIGYVGTRLALRWLPTDRLEINIAADYTDENSDPAQQLVEVTNPAALPPVSLNGVMLGTQFDTAGTYKSYSTYCNNNHPSGGTVCFDPYAETDVWGVMGTIDFEVSDNISLKSITAYRASESYNVVDGDGSPLTVTNTQIGYRNRQFSQELRLNAQLMDSLSLTAGVYYLDGYVNGEQEVNIAYINNNFINDDDTDVESKAAYGQLVFDVTDRLTIVGGLRYTEEKQEYVFYRTRPDGNDTPVPGLFDTNDPPYEGDSLDYRINASFKVSPVVMIYGQYATAFKGGGLNGQVFFPDQVYPFDPEQIGTFEAGFKSSFLDNRATFNFAGFYSDYTDIQLQAQSCPPPSTPFPCAGPQNVGSAHIKGVEAELFMEPVEGLEIDASIAYLDFEYYELLNTPNITLDMVSPYTPEWSGSLGIQYEAVLGNSGSIIPRMDLSYRSHIFTDPVSGPLNRIDERTLVNARLTYISPDRDWELSARVTNLFDEYYLSNLIDNTRFTGLRFPTPGEPRRWYVSVRKNF